jgi:hypothetical protein
MQPIIFQSIVENKKYIVGENKGWIPYDEETYLKIMKAWEEVKTSQLIKNEPIQEEIFEVVSNSDPSKKYTITKHRSGKLSCTCAGYGFRRKCKHIDSFMNKGN